MNDSCLQASPSEPSVSALATVGLLAICLNMAFAVLERLAQRHLMAQVYEHNNPRGARPATNQTPTPTYRRRSISASRE